jgi:hypothetical protein
MPPVFDVATAPAETRQPDPDRAMPPCVGKVLGLVRTLIAYGQNLADMLRQHSAAPHLLPFLPFIVINFGTTDLAPILTRITRGLLRAGCARREAQQARRPRPGPDAHAHPSAPRQPPRRQPAALPHDPAGDPSLASPPTIEQIIAKDRRRPVGAVLVDICRDLRIAPGRMDRATWDELRLAITLYGGNLVTLIFSPDGWKLSEDLLSNLNDSPPPTDASAQPIIAFPPWPAPPEQPTPLAGLGCEAGQDWGRGPGP